ncbi:ATP-binding cassette domain-containing protein [Paenibacillus humicola]|uniref:ATP-binding cassette domain-containing protein n=1 Tax=Paenibacillus humicola TaxID=3110540 RepID=UPI00237A143C|nr:ABC transporter ATP-binding protein [Paenibacillus humicola]
MTEPIIVCDRVTKRYGRKTALDSLTVAIPAGRIVGVLGPNGCGKSSLFRTVAGLTKPDSGRVEVLGRSPGWQANGGIAYLPDRARWYPNQTAMKAFEWGQAFLPGFDLKTALRFAELMEVEPDMKFGGMSRGEEARVLLILCMAREVPLILLDEPFAGIDIMSRESIVAGMIDLIEARNQSMLISTHDIHEVEGMFDYTVMLDKGRAAWAGDTEELRAEYGSLHNVFRTMYKKEWAP